MDFRDIFTRVFGFPNRRPPGFGYYNEDDRSSGYHEHYDNEDGENEDERSFEFFFDSSGNKGGLGGVFSEIEHFHQQMNEMMRAFGSINFTPTLPPSGSTEDERPEFPSFSFGFGNSSPFFHNGPDQPRVQQPQSPRDLMLREGHDSEAEASSKPEIGSIYMPKKPDAVQDQDSDLDGKLSEQDIMSLVKPSVEQEPKLMWPHQQPPNFFSSSSSVTTFSSYTGPDGKIEKKKVVRDSSGREETTVTRSVGDKSHSVTTITKQDGSQEKHETFHNMDETDRGKFENAWSSKQTPHQVQPADELVPYVGPQIDGRDRDLFSKLFGFRIPK